MRLRMEYTGGVPSGSFSLSLLARSGRDFPPLFPRELLDVPLLTPPGSPTVGSSCGVQLSELFTQPPQHVSRGSSFPPLGVCSGKATTPCSRLPLSNLGGCSLSPSPHLTGLRRAAHFSFCSLYTFWEGLEASNILTYGTGKTL